MKLLDHIVRTEGVFSRILDTIMTLFFILIFLIVFTLVLLRYVFSKSLFGGAELITVMFIYASAFGSALLFREQKHIRISFFIEKIPAKARKVIVIFSYICNMIFHVSLIYLATQWIQATGQYKTAILKIPYALMQVSISVYAGIVLIYVARNIVLVLTQADYLERHESSSDYEGL